MIVETRSYQSYSIVKKFGDVVYVFYYTLCRSPGVIGDQNYMLIESDGSIAAIGSHEACIRALGRMADHMDDWE